jgi:hypothetical protein
MVAEVFAGLSAIKTAFDIAKGLKDIDDATRRNAAVIELQEKILFAQAAQLELVETIGELKNAWLSLKHGMQIRSATNLKISGMDRSLTR